MLGKPTNTQLEGRIDLQHKSLWRIEFFRLWRRLVGVLFTWSLTDDLGDNAPLSQKDRENMVPAGFWSCDMDPGEI